MDILVVFMNAYSQMAQILMNESMAILTFINNRRAFGYFSDHWSVYAIISPNDMVGYWKAAEHWMKSIENAYWSFKRSQTRLAFVNM